VQKQRWGHRAPAGAWGGSPVRSPSQETTLPRTPARGLCNLCMAWEDAPTAERTKFRSYGLQPLDCAHEPFQTAWYVGCLPASHLSEAELGGSPMVYSGLQ